METSILPAVIVLILGGGLLFIGIRKMHHQELEQQLRQAEWDLHHAREESEIALSVSRNVVKNAAARIAKVYGDDYLDYHIARQMALPDVRQASEAALQREAELKQQVEYYRQRDALRIAEFTEMREDYRRLQEDENRRRADAVLREHTANFERRSSHYAPPQYWQAQPQAPIVHRRDVLPCWDDDVLDVDVRPLSQPPVYPLALQSQPTTCRATLAQGGRQRKYASDAERQAAYRARRKARLG